MIIHTPIGFVPKGDPTRKKVIFEEKKKILNLPHADKYFIMKDMDIEYVDGIRRMIAFLDKNEKYGALALWPYVAPIQREHHDHISSQFVMIRSEAVTTFDLNWSKKCFCQHLCDYLRFYGWEIKYFSKGKIINHG